MRCIVLGAGRQGLAIAYDLARHGGADEITLVDASAKVVRAGAKRLRALVPGLKVKQHAKALRGNDATTLMRGHDVAVSGMPYRFNPALSKAAVRAKVSFCDLGGNTDLVKEQLKLKDAAKKAGVTIVPDCGLAPGLGNVLAAIAIGEVPGVQHVHIRCGGLPLEPKGPLGYSLLFSIEGLTNEYRGEAVVVRDGRIQRFEAFTEPENIKGPPGLGLLQCFFTSGGTSTAPWRYKGKLKTYEYKTVRYHGHFDRGRKKSCRVRCGTRWRGRSSTTPRRRTARSCASTPRTPAGAASATRCSRSSTTRRASLRWSRRRATRRRWWRQHSRARN
jgi:lysine 6-dehydrogenase